MAALAAPAIDVFAAMPATGAGMTK